ncbi:hypothetical protein BDP27DRAFT_1429329 [Rhodocollybia butyracea]|uniref:Uncharacterized protein n=1 Tax=Rhodocollybia butyracea TaxID=206335 RepID=A0A9P5U071_9AGAR|nr:hypothetical protein BDP27DRAFT_1429329 [Rhodocollybia butyracea]
MFRSSRSGFCRKVQENKVKDPITAADFPQCILYGDLGRAARCSEESVLHTFLEGKLLLLVWVAIFLSKANAEAVFSKLEVFDEGNKMTNSFAVKKVSKVYMYNITSVTYPSITYAYYIFCCSFCGYHIFLQLHQVLPKSNHRRINDQNIPKQDAFNAIIQIFENPDLKDNDWTDQCLAKWDEGNILRYWQWVVAAKHGCKRAAAKKAAKEAAIAANTPSTSSPDPALSTPVCNTSPFTPDGNIDLTNSPERNSNAHPSGVKSQYPKPSASSPEHNSAAHPTVTKAQLPKPPAALASASHQSQITGKPVSSALSASKPVSSASLQPAMTTSKPCPKSQPKHTSATSNFIIWSMSIEPMRINDLLYW